MDALGGTWAGARRVPSPRGRSEELVTDLYAQFRDALFAHVMGLTNRDRQWSEDVVQETLVRAWQNAETLVRDPRMLRGWLLAVAGRIVVDGWRGGQAGPGQAGPGQVGPGQVGSGEVEPTGHDPVPAHAPDGTGRGLFAVVLDDVIGRLDEEHRAAIRETYVRGRTVREAAVVLGIPEGVVKSRVYHAMKILRRALREWD